MSRDIAVLIPAAGRGHRFGAETNKLFATLNGRPIWRHTLDRFASRPDVARIILAVDESDRERFDAEISSESLAAETVIGGAERMDSVRAALEVIADDTSIALIAIHDAARPLVTDNDIESVFQTARTSGAAFLGTPISGSLHRRSGDTSAPVDRRDLFQAATPQVFESELFRRAYQRHNGRPVTDDVQLVGRTGHPVEVVTGRTDNLKITFPEDLLVAEAILRSRMV